VLALLALALFPVIAHAEESSEKVYKVAPPTLESGGETTSHPHKSVTPNNSENHAKAEGSAVPSGGGGGTGSGSGGQKPSGEGSSQGGGGNPPTGGGRGGSGGNPTGAGSGGGGGIAGAKEVPTPTENHASESSSSSPVVPILIAVVVLAAISIGVVLYRQRKSGQGPDGRVSSPNAS
jgi:cobalamin biosynthesis Mg chelatase CobN